MSLVSVISYLVSLIFAALTIIVLGYVIFNVMGRSGMFDRIPREKRGFLVNMIYKDNNKVKV